MSSNDLVVNGAGGTSEEKDGSSSRLPSKKQLGESASRKKLVDEAAEDDEVAHAGEDCQNGVAGEDSVAEYHHSRSKKGLVAVSSGCYHLMLPEKNHDHRILVNDKTTPSTQIISDEVQHYGNQPVVYYLEQPAAGKTTEMIS